MKKISKIMIAMILLVALVMSSTAATGSLNFFSAPQDGDVATIESGDGQLVAKAAVGTYRIKADMYWDSNVSASDLAQFTREETADAHSIVMSPVDGSINDLSYYYQRSDCGRTLISDDPGNTSNHLPFENRPTRDQMSKRCHYYYRAYSASRGWSSNYFEVSCVPVQNMPPIYDFNSVTYTGSPRSLPDIVFYSTGTCPFYVEPDQYTISWQYKSPTDSGFSAYNSTTFTNAGTYKVTVTAKNVVNGDYNVGSSSSATFVVNSEQNQTTAVGLASNSYTYNPTGITLTPNGGNGTGAYSWAVGTQISGGGVATKNGDTLSVTKSGQININVTRAASAGWKARTDTVTITVNKANQVALETNFGVWTYGTPNIVLGKSTNTGGTIMGVYSGGSGGGAITYGSSTDTTGVTGAATITPEGAVTVTKAGVVKFKATKAGDANYNETTITVICEIYSKDITNAASITTPIANKTYTGAAIVPADSEIALKYGAKTLTKGTDYTVAFADNTNAGTNTAKCNVTFRGNYSGTQTFTWTISRLDLTGTGVTTVGLPTSTIYTAAEQTPITAIKYGGKTLDSSTDYSGVYTSNKEVGTAKYTVTFNGNYSGTKYFTWEISKFDIGTNAENKITIDPIANITYNGAEHKVTPTVKFSNMLLGVSNVDFSYLTSGGYFDAGDKTVTITGKGNFSGSTTATYKITPKVVNITPKAFSKVYGTANPTLTDSEIATGVTGETLTVTYTGSFPTNVGKTAITAVTIQSVQGGRANKANYFASLQNGAEKLEVTADKTTSGGAFETKPTAPLSFNEGVVYKDDDLGFKAKGAGATIAYLYKVSTAGDATYSDKKPTAHGIYTVKATISGNSNYDGAALTATRDFTVNDLEITSLKIESVSLNADNTYSIKVALGLKGSFNHGEHFGIIVKKDGTFQKYTETSGNITQATWDIDVGGFAVGSEYTIETHIGANENEGDQTPDVTATVVKFAIPTIQNDYSNQKFYGFETGSYSINDALPFDATAESRIDNSAYKATTASIVRKGNNSTATITKDSVAADKAITYDSAPQSLKVNVGSVESVQNHVFDGTAYNPAPKLTIGGAEYTAEFTKTYKIKNGETYSTIEPANLINAGLYRVEYSGNTAEFNGIIYTTDFAITKIPVTVGTGDAAPKIAPITYGANYATLDATGSTPPTSKVTNKAVVGAFTVEFTPTAEQLSTSGHLKAGTYTAKVVFTPSGDDAVNYEIMKADVQFTVTPKAITGLTFAKTYDGKAEFEYSSEAITGVLASDLVKINGSTTSANAAVYAGTAMAPGGADKDNYTFDATATLTINKAPLTFTKMDATIVKFFDGAATTGGAQFVKGTHYGVTGLIGGEEGLTDNIKAGDGYAIVFSNSIIADNLTADVTITLPTALSNYTIAVGGTLSGYKAAINGVTVDPTKDYTMTPSKTNGQNGWYNTTVTFVPKGDYHFVSNELNGSYSEALVVSDRTNAPYIFYLKVSENGAVAQVKIFDLKIDTTAPKITTAGISQVENKEGGKPLGGDATAIANNTKENVKITIPYVEATSGIDHIVVKVGDVVYAVTEYTNNAEAKTLSFVVDKNGTYSVTLVDVAGNESAATDVIVKNIDRTLPTIEVKVNNLPVADANSKKWYGNATVTAVGSTTYAGDTTAKAVIKDYDGNVTATETNTATMTIDKNGISTVIVTVTDALGNVNTMKVVVKVDKNIDTFNAMVDALTNASAENDWLTAITTFEKYTAAQKDHIMGKDANDTSKANYAKLMKWKLDHETEITGTLKEKKITELVGVIKTAIGDPDTGTITIDNIDKAIEEIKKATEETKTDPRVKDLIDEVEKLIKLKEELAKIIAPVDPTNPNKNLQVIEPGTYTQLTQIIDVYDKLDPGVEAPTSFIKEILEKLVANTDDIEPVTPPYSVKEKIDELKGKKKKIDEFVKEVDKVTPVTPTNFPTDPGSVVTPTVTSIIGQVVPNGGGMVDPGTGLVKPITGITIPGTTDPGTGTPEPSITIPIELFPEETKDDLEEVIDIKEVVEEIKKLIGELPDPNTGIIIDPTITIEVKIKEIEELIDNLKKTIDGGDGLIDGGSKKDLEDVKKKVDEVNKDKDDKNKKIDKAIVDILDVLKNIDDVSTPKEILDAKKKFDELDPEVKNKIKTGNLLDTLKPNYFDVDTEGKLIDNGTDYTDGNEVTSPDVNPDLIKNANKVYVETPDPSVDPGTLPLINVIKNIDVTEVTGGKLDELKEIKKKYDELTKAPVTNDKTTQKKLIDNDEEIKKKIDEVDKLIEKIEEVIRLVGEIPADGSPTCQICLTHDKEYHEILPDDKSVNGQTEFHKGAIDKAKMAYEKLTVNEKKYIDDTMKKIIDDGYKHLKDYLKDAAREQKVVITDTENNVSVFGIATQVDTSEVDMAADVIDIFMTAEKTDSAIEELSKDLKKVVSYDVKLWAKTNGDENTKKMIQPAAGKSVVVKLPIAADADLSTLRIYHVKGDGSRSLVYPYTISYEGGTTYAVFEVSSFSEFIAYAEKSKNSGGTDGGGGGMTIDPGDIFWKSTEIDIGKEGETKVIIDIDKVKDKQIPKEIIEKIIDKGKDLVVKEGGKDTTLTNEDLKKLTLTENSYTLAELLALIEKANKPAVTPTPTPTEKPTEPTDPTEPTAKKCWLCGACPMFLGICLWIWLAIAIVVVAVVVIIVVRKKKKNDKNE